MAQATVKDVAEFFNALVHNGKGDYAVTVNTQEGAEYDLSTTFLAAAYDAIKVVTIGD